MVSKLSVGLFKNLLMQQQLFLSVLCMNAQWITRKHNVAQSYALLCFEYSYIWVKDLIRLDPDKKMDVLKIINNKEILQK